MTSDQLKLALSAREASCVANAVTVARPASIRFLDMKNGRRVYMKRVIDLQQSIQIMVWPYQNNRTSIAGGSRALFLGAQTNRGLHNGCVVRRTFQERYQEVLLRVHALAACCSKELPYLGVYVTQLSAGQGLNRHKDYRNHDEYYNYTIKSCAVPLLWTEFTADIIEHRVREVTSGDRFAVTLFTPGHLERLGERDWMNLESNGFPVHLYAERAQAGTGACLEETGAEMVEKQAVAHALTVETEVDGPSVQALQMSQAGRADKMEDALTQLADQIPRPNPVRSGAAGQSLCQLALLAREFNCAMGLSEGESLKVVSPERGQQYGQMLREEIGEVEEAIRSGILHDVLAEVTDVLYLILNLGQECGLQDCMEAAFLMKHGDNMRKQHESVTHLSWTRTAYAKACNSTEESLNYTVSRTNKGKWLLYSNGKLIKPYDYVPSEYAQLLVQEVNEGSDLESEHPERAPQPVHTSVHDSSQYTFAHIGVQLAMCDGYPKGATDQTGQHGWQSAIMTGMMWLSNVVGEYLTKLDQESEVAPIHLPRLIDDPVSTLEQVVMDLQIAHEAREIPGILKQLGLLMYYTMLMATTMRLHPYLRQLSCGYMNGSLARSMLTLLQPKAHMRC